MEYKNILDILLMNNYLIYYLYLNDYLIQEFIEFDLFTVFELIYSITNI